MLRNVNCMVLPGRLTTFFKNKMNVKKTMGRISHCISLLTEIHQSIVVVDLNTKNCHNFDVIAQDEALNNLR